MKCESWPPVPQRNGVMGQERFPRATELLITADGGGHFARQSQAILNEGQRHTTPFP